MIVLGMIITIPASIVAAFAPSTEVLFAARVVGGLSAGMAYPTTLALITALWSGPARTRSIAAWSALGGGVAMLGPLVSGFLLQYFVWGSVFLVTVPLALLALYMARRHVPAHVKEATEPVDNIGGVLSAIMIGSLIVALNFITVPNMQGLAVGLLVVAAIVLALFVVRQKRAPTRSTTWRSRRASPSGWRPWPASSSSAHSWASPSSTSSTSRTCSATTRCRPGAAILPAAFFMVLVAPRSAKLVHERGSRATLLLGQGFLGLAFIGMFFLWGEDTPYWIVAIPLCLMGLGVGLAGTPSSNSLTGSVPVRRVGMASGTADLQRDLGGALMTSIFGALLTAGYAAAMGTAITDSGEDVTATTQSELQVSYASAEDLAEQYPQYSDEIMSAAQSSFLDGDQFTYVAGLVAVLIGGGLT